jgi:hypothetical protein
MQSRNPTRDEFQRLDGEVIHLRQTVGDLLIAVAALNGARDVDAPPMVPRPEAVERSAFDEEIQYANSNIEEPDRPPQ